MVQTRWFSFPSFLRCCSSEVRWCDRCLIIIIFVVCVCCWHITASLIDKTPSNDIWISYTLLYFKCVHKLKTQTILIHHRVLSHMALSSTFTSLRKPQIRLIQLERHRELLKWGGGENISEEKEHIIRQQSSQNIWWEVISSLLRLSKDEILSYGAYSILAQDWKSRSKYWE